MKINYSKQSLNKGDVLNENNIIVRPAYGLHPKYYYKVLGKKNKKTNWVTIKIHKLKTILFRLDYGENFGGGHLSRCLFSRIYKENLK